MFITYGRPLRQVVVTGVNLVNKMESCSSVELLDLLYKESSLAVTIDLLKKERCPLSQPYFRVQSITYFCLGDILYKTSLLNYNPVSNNVRMTLSDCVMGNALGLLRPLKIN